MNATPPLLSVDNLHVVYGHGKKAFHALRGVSLDIGLGETVGLVGESGSGKTTLGRAILGQASVHSGTIAFDGKDITRLTRRERRPLGRELQVVFQDPYGSLNPTRTIGQTLLEPLLVDREISPRHARERVAEVLDLIGMPTDTLRRYPAQFSGGQRQRIAIARAVVCRPRLIVCDEPVSALDLSVQAQVLNLLSDLQRELRLSMLFVSHDLTVVRHVSHRTVVLYRGEIVEEGSAGQVHDAPQHPYTRALLAAAPVPHPIVQRERRSTPTSTQPVPPGMTSR